MTSSPDPGGVVVHADAAEALAHDEDLLLRWAATTPVPAFAGSLSRLLAEYGRRGRRAAELDQELAENRAALDLAVVMLNRWVDLHQAATARAKELSGLLRGMAGRASEQRQWIRAAENEQPR